MKFPENFTKTNHDIIPNATQWLYSKNNIIISIIGGGIGPHGDGITTFEMWDYRDEYPKGHLTVDEINDHLRNNPIV